MFTKLYRTYNAEDFVLDENFRRSIEGKLGSNKYLEKLIDKHPGKTQEIEMAIKMLQELKTGKYIHSTEKKQELWGRIIFEQKRQLRLQFYRYAAAGLLLLGIGSASFYLVNKQPSLENFAASNKVSFKNAELILADGKKIGISSKESKVRYTADGNGVSVNDSASMGQVNTDNGFNQLVVPFGKRSTIILSDGTKVWLNSGSRLVYTPVFRGNTRDVYLEGEGYFEVTKNAEKPFFVRTDAFKVKVYGTKFNVQAYKNDADYNTVLLEGKVSLNFNERLRSKEVFMTPNQKASFSIEENGFEVTHVDKAENYIAWIDGYLAFDNEEVPNLIRRVSHYYNIPIEAKLGGIPVKISGKLDLKDDPERVLTALAVISKTRYMKQENKYLFYE